MSIPDETVEDIEGFSTGGDGPALVLRSSDPLSYMLLWLWSRAAMHADFPPDMAKKALDFSRSMHDWLHASPLHREENCSAATRALCIACSEFVKECIENHTQEGESDGKEVN